MLFNYSFVTMWVCACAFASRTTWVCAYAFTNSLVEYQEYALENTWQLSMMSQLKQKRSPVWEYFELVDAIQDGKKIKNARCKLCKNTQLAYKGSTTNMINHIQAKHHSAYQESFPSSQSSSSSSTKRQATLSLVTKKCSPAHSKDIDELVSDFVARDLRPIAIVDGPGFKNLVHFLEPGYKVPSRTHVMSTLRKKYDALKHEGAL